MQGIYDIFLSTVAKSVFSLEVRFLSDFFIICQNITQKMHAEIQIA